MAGRGCLRRRCCAGILSRDAAPWTNAPQGGLLAGRRRALRSAVRYRAIWWCRWPGWVSSVPAARSRHHHGLIGDPTAPAGTGVILWFETAQFDSAVARARSASAHVVTDVHVNSNAGHRESWLRDLDGYLVVLAERDE